MAETATQLKLYDRDFVAWCEDTVVKLKERNLNELDFEALIEEIEGLGLRDRRELESRLGVLLAHLLKRLYIRSVYDYRGWENTIEDQRRELHLLLKQSPSLRNYFDEVFDDSWRYALKRLKKDYLATQFPEEWEFSRDVDALLTADFWVTDEAGEQT